MKYKKLFTNKSIKFRLMSIFIIIIVTLVLGLTASIINQITVNKELNNFVDNNRKISTLPIEINNSSASFEKYLREKNIADLAEYNAKNVYITAILEHIRYDLGDDKDNLIYYRTLKNMHEYQQELAGELLEYEIYEPKMYTKMSYLRTLFSYMNRQAQLLTMSYLDYSSDKYVNLLEDSNNRNKKIYLTIIIFSFISIAVGIVLSMDLLVTLDKVTNTANKLANGKFDIEDLEANDFIELNMVAKAFNNMKKDIKLYISELSKKAEIEIQLNKEKLINVEKDKLLKEAQLLTLQMQMNPHFLFNTLNMIGRTAMFEDTKSTVKLIESISEILRYNLDNKGKLVPLEKEISVLKAYIFIQKMRFQERLAFSLQISDEINENIKDINIPPMTLQPIVENAIVHGLKNTVEGGQININIFKKDGFLHANIDDNGIGISKDIVSNIITNKVVQKENSNIKKSLGMLNVKNRLELQYEQENLLKIVSQKGRGTSVTLLFPMERSS